ncbi:MAG: hypothetical protein J0L92_24730 [Deltaproteobacteria bacterium]|nr:hypothetical protein [Deltaproteobacteria bacterium]
MLRPQLFALVIATSSLLFVGAATQTEVARAQAASSLDDEARGLFMAARAAYGAGRFEEALELFERSYRTSPRPELLYNIGQVADRLRRDERVIEAFSQYLEQVPDAPNRLEVETRLRVLRAAAEARRAEQAAIEARLAALTATQPAPSTTESVPPASSGVPTEALVSTTPAPSRSEDLTWLWVTIGVVVAAGIGVSVAVPLTTSSSTEVLGPVPGDVGPGGLVIALESP